MTEESFTQRRATTRRRRMFSASTNVERVDMSRNIYDTPTMSMYKYKGVYNRERRQFFDRADIQAKGLMVIRSTGDRLQKNAHYNMAPADEMRPVNRNQGGFGTAKEIFNELENKQSFYGSKAERLNSDTYITE